MQSRPTTSTQSPPAVECRPLGGATTPRFRLGALLFVLFAALVGAPAARAVTFSAASGSPFAAGPEASSVAVADFNEDEVPDLAVGSGANGSVSVLLGAGDGTFSAASGSPFAAIQHATSVVSADFNGDEHTDLAISNSEPSWITALLGDGSAGFSTASGSPFWAADEEEAHQLVAADFNGDEDVDLAVTNYEFGAVSVFLGDGSGGFSAASGSPIAAGGGAGAVGLAAADFNDDEDLDLVVTNLTTGTAWLLLGDGEAGFDATTGSPFAFGDGGEFASVAVADFNGDEEADLAVSDYEYGMVHVALGDGSGGFSTASGSPFAAGTDPASLASTDFNGDENTDLVVANSGGSSLLLGGGDGTFSAADSLPPVSGGVPVGVVGTDLNGDTHPDIAVARGGGVSVLLNGPPNASIVSGPSIATRETAATLSFQSHDSSSTFDCQFDEGGWTACASPAEYSGLASGPHAFEVRATNDVGFTDPTAARREWTLLAPDTSIFKAPAGTTRATTAEFTFGSQASNPSFECKLDGGAWGDCESPKSYSGLSTGAHIFDVRAVDDADNVDPIGDTYEWTLLAPDTSITAGPSGTTRATTAEFTFGSQASNPSFECKLDGGAWDSCGSPAKYSALGNGGHAFNVRAVDDADNVDPTGAAASWNVDLTTPPVAALGVSPNPVLSGASVTLDASGSHDPLDGAIVDYQWDLQGDGSFERDTGTNPMTSSSYNAPGVVHPQVRVMNNVGTTAFAAVGVDVRPTPPPGEVGISIDDGNYATNTTAVQLYVVWPAFASKALISNDGGFNAAGETKTVALTPAIPWTLRSEGTEKLPKIAYVRFPDSSFPTQTFTDDIVLDTTVPVIESATPAESAGPSAVTSAGRSGRVFRVRIHAREKLSGISMAQLSTNRKEGTTVVLTDRTRQGIRRLAQVVKARLAKRPRFVRVRSAAGNWSEWHRIGLRKKHYKRRKLRPS